MAKPMQVGHVKIGLLFWLSPAPQHGTTEREIAADCRRCPSGVSRGLPVTEFQGRYGIPTSSCHVKLPIGSSVSYSYAQFLSSPLIVFPWGFRRLPNLQMACMCFTVRAERYLLRRPAAAPG